VGTCGWLPKAPGFALFGNQPDVTVLKTRGLSSHELPGEAKAQVGRKAGANRRALALVELQGELMGAAS